MHMILTGGLLDCYARELRDSESPLSSRRDDELVELRSICVPPVVKMRIIGLAAVVAHISLCLLGLRQNSQLDEVLADEHIPYNIQRSENGIDRSYEGKDGDHPVLASIKAPEAYDVLHTEQELRENPEGASMLDLDEPQDSDHIVWGDVDAQNDLLASGVGGGGFDSHGVASSAFSALQLGEMLAEDLDDLPAWSFLSQTSEQVKNGKKGEGVGNPDKDMNSISSIRVQEQRRDKMSLPHSERDSSKQNENMSNYFSQRPALNPHKHEDVVLKQAVLEQNRELSESSSFVNEGSSSRSRHGARRARVEVDLRFRVSRDGDGNMLQVKDFAGKKTITEEAPASWQQVDKSSGHHLTQPDVTLSGPPLGWMSWEYFRCQRDCWSKHTRHNCISEKLFQQMADVIVDDGYRDAGYNLVWVDDCWIAGRGRHKEVHIYLYLVSVVVCALYFFHPPSPPQPLQLPLQPLLQFPQRPQPRKVC